MREAPLRFVSASFQRRAGGHPNESHDCTVRAISLAAGIEYKDAHAIMELAERRPLHGANMAVGLVVAQELGMLQFRKIPLRPSVFTRDREDQMGRDAALFTATELKNPRAKYREGFQDTWVLGRYVYYTQPQRQITLSLILKKIPKGRYILCSNDHAFAVVDGVVHDSSPIGLNTRIRLCYQIVEA